MAAQRRRASASASWLAAHRRKWRSWRVAALALVSLRI